MGDQKKLRGIIYDQELLHFRRRKIESAPVNEHTGKFLNIMSLLFRDFISVFTPL